MLAIVTIFEEEKQLGKWLNVCVSNNNNKDEIQVVAAIYFGTQVSHVYLDNYSTNYLSSTHFNRYVVGFYIENANKQTNKQYG